MRLAHVCPLPVGRPWLASEVKIRNRVGESERRLRSSYKLLSSHLPTTTHQQKNMQAVLSTSATAVTVRPAASKSSAMRVWKTANNSASNLGTLERGDGARGRGEQRSGD